MKHPYLQLTRQATPDLLTHMAQRVGGFAWQSGSVAEPSFVLRLVKGKADKGPSGPAYDTGLES